MIIYPNPNFGNFEVHYYTDVANDKYFIVRNMIGKIIYSSAIYSTANELYENVNLRDMGKGMYFIEMHSGDNIEAGKVIIQ